MNYAYRVIYSKRRTLAVEITPEEEVVVRAPIGTSNERVEAFLLRCDAWVERHMRNIRQRNREHPAPDATEIRELCQKAKAYLPQAVAYYAKRMGVTPTAITVTSAKKRFGSCSSQNRLCFSYLLMRYPKEAVDYVVVHELAHIRHHNHSPAFWKFVGEHMPDYKERAKMLRG